MILYWGDENMLKLTVVRVAQVCDYVKKHGFAHSKWADFMVCEVYLSKALKTLLARQRPHFLICKHTPVGRLS